ncbi:IclR family transcriptional regulator [Nocardia sp. NBC_00416]|uniref:IclR family transcriptional regulator n=1 Tax=Nocardia sp. NBC_00416 TaxID=2975991 RepID=UPI002E1D4169
MNASRIDRALAVLGYLAHHHEGRSLKHLSDDLKLPMSSTHDLMQALVEIGAVRVAGPRTYALGPRAVTIALTVVDSLSLRDVARPHLTELCEEINEHVYLGIRVGAGVTYADRYEASQPLAVVMQLGGERPLHGSAVGKLLAAYNPELEAKVLAAPRLEPLTAFTIVDRDQLQIEYAKIRERGFSVTDGESVEGITGISTPIVGVAGETIAAVHVSAPRGRLASDRLPIVLKQMQRAAAKISLLLGADDDAMRTHHLPMED